MKFGEEAVCAMLDALNEAGVSYMLVGSFSSNAYGESRSTKDADFVVQLAPEERRAVFQALPDEFEIDPQPLFETITGHTRQIVRVPSIPFEIELFDLSHDAFDQSRFSRRMRTTMSGRTVWLPTAEDVIVQKLRWAKLANRLKDFLDAQGVLKVRAELLDWQYIEQWCERLAIRDKLDELRQA